MRLGTRAHTHTHPAECLWTDREYSCTSRLWISSFQHAHVTLLDEDEQKETLVDPADTTEPEQQSLTPSILLHKSLRTLL